MAEGKGGLGMYLRLQLAYALEFAIWGCWSYALGSFCSNHSIAQGSLYSAFAFGALFAPLVGPIADRKFAAQKVLAFMQLICGLALAGAYVVAGKVVAAGGTTPGALWWALMFIAGLMFMPSIPLLNAIVFKHIPNDKKSPFVFIFGTIGWIVVNWVISAMGDAGIEKFYLVDALVAIVFAVYALTLPNTPPSGAKNDDPFGFKALKLFKRWDFASFIVCATLVGIFGSNYYFAYVGECFPGKGVCNQYSEIIFMAALAFAVSTIGLKKTLVLGMGAWGVRYLCFATGNNGLAWVGILCHGMAYAFLYTAAYMYADKVAPKELKASVQALVAFLLLGVAQTLSGYFSNWMKDWFPGKDNTQAAEVTVIESVSFSNLAFAQDEAVGDAIVDAATEAGEAVVEVAQDATEATADAVEDAVEATAEAVEDAAAATAEAVEDAAAATAEAVEDAAEATADAVEDAVAADGSAKKTSFSDYVKNVWDPVTWNKYNWKMIWGIPGVFCLFWAIVFALVGREPKAAEEENA